MIIQLVKKDCLIIKKYLVFMSLFLIGSIIYFSFRLPKNSGMTIFLIIVIFVEFLLHQSICMQEMKYPKAAALLCAAPYSRKSLVEARYLFFSAIFIYCYAVYQLISLFLPQVHPLEPGASLFSLAVVAIIYGTITPVQYKFGYEKTKYIFMVVLMGSSFGIPLFIKSGISFNFSFWLQLPLFIQYALPIILIIVFIIVSLKVSIHIYNNLSL